MSNMQLDISFRKMEILKKYYAASIYLVLPLLRVLVVRQTTIAKRLFEKSSF